MNYTPEEVARLLCERPNQPHYIAGLVRRAIAAATAELRRERADLLDRIVGTPCAEIRWEQERARMHEEWLSLKDQYSELARAVGCEGDALFGDPLESHAEVVAKAVNQRLAVQAVEAAPEETLHHMGGGLLAAELVLPEVWGPLDGKRVRLVCVDSGDDDRITITDKGRAMLAGEG